MTVVGVAVAFAGSGLLILLAGVRVSLYGDVIAQKTGLGGTWVGLLLVAAVTSLPELVTGASSVLVFDVPDIAVGNVVGSCMFNLVLLAFLDFRNPVPLAARIHQGHVLSAAFGIVLLGLAALAILAGGQAPSIGWVGVHSLFFIAFYAFAMRTIFTFERTRMAQLAEELPAAAGYADLTLRRAILGFTGAALILVVAAALLPGLAEQLSAMTGLGDSVTGSLLVAACTVLPEVVVSTAAARMGAVDMAAANLFGSNLFNLAVLGIDDVLYRRGALLASASAVHVVSLTTAMIMSAIVIVGLTYRAARKRYRLSWDALALLAVYTVGTLLLLAFG